MTSRECMRRYYRVKNGSVCRMHIKRFRRKAERIVLNPERFGEPIEAGMVVEGVINETLNELELDISPQEWNELYPEARSLVLNALGVTEDDITKELYYIYDNDLKFDRSSL